MKYLLPVVMLAAAAWAAQAQPHGALARGLAQSREPQRPPPEVPWLNPELSGQFAAAAGSVPHAALHEEDDPHAGLYGEDDPHAGLYGEDDPHAGLYTAVPAEAEGALAGGTCPHLADTAEQGGDFDGDPHAAVAYEDGDPHAAVAYEDDEPHAGARSPAAQPPQGVARSSAPNGHTIAELYAQRSALAERPVSVRGVVVKRTDGILGESYLHLQDGSGSAARQDHDLTITTTEELALGETVEVQGLVRVDRDLGLGYRYAVMLTGATQVRVQ